MTKQELRKLYHSKRKDLTLGECQVMDNLLLERLQCFDWNTCQYLHVFMPILNHKEPNSLLFVDWIRRTHPHIQLVIPKVEAGTSNMIHFLWDEHTRLVLNKWGIPEPVEGTVVSEHVLDAVLVPLLVADGHGNRVGYGKGFYDRFLSRCKSDIKTIGLSFFEVVDVIDDVGAWDYQLDYCVTPWHTYVF